MLLSIHHIASKLEKLAPPHLAEEYDNVGLLLGSREQEITRAVVCLDVTKEIIKEAIEIGAGLIISHHPPWFQPRLDLRGDDFTSQVLLYAIENKISLYACHTNLDNVSVGVNKAIADKLELSKREVLLPFPEEKKALHKINKSERKNIGSGMIGELERPLSVKSFLGLLHQLFRSECIRHSEMPNTKKIHRLAICGGAGAFLLENILKREDIDSYVTSDLSYHKFFEAQKKLLLVDIGHYESEQYTTDLIISYLREEIPDLEIRKAKHSTNPVKYFTSPTLL